MLILMNPGDMSGTIPLAADGVDELFVDGDPPERGLVLITIPTRDTGEMNPVTRRDDDHRRYPFRINGGKGSPSCWAGIRNSRVWTDDTPYRSERPFHPIVGTAFAQHLPEALGIGGIPTSRIAGFSHSVHRHPLFNHCNAELHEEL